MNRCLSLSDFRATRWLAALGCTVMLALAGPAAAQTVQPVAGTTVRTFPPAALRGNLVVQSTVEATINGKTVRMAPGMRLFSAENRLLPLHSVKGQRLRVNYVNEVSTGMLHTAWVLNSSEAALKREGADASDTNIRFESDKPQLK